MAVATKKRGKSSPARKPTGKSKKVIAKAKRPPAKPNGAASKPSSNGAAMSTSGPGRFAAEQPPLAGMEDIDDRIPALDEACQRAIANREKAKSAAQEFAEDLEKIGALLKDNDLDCYIIVGKKFFIEPGEPHVKMLKVKQQ